MSALHEGLRKQLEKTVIQAREVAEEGARAALDRLGVGRARAYEGVPKAESDLRARLRAKGKQLGDVRKPSGEQETQRIAGELAYEYWHRMLFARFLAENDLLMHPEAGVSVSLADCEELAREEGLANGWLLAERWAAHMLPEIFRPADPLLQVPFAPEYERALEKLLESLPAETFRASDALGWVYQFWQARRKDEVNKSGVKIGAEELPAVTQLFTEPYMVHFLLDNTVGAWWAARHPGEVPPVTFDYLRLLEDGTPAAGTFDGWPKRVAELKLLDPCCGSGHFLVSAFLKLVPLRMHEEELSAREACDSVLRDNLHGLEIDPRCTQIAAFAVALSAWTYPEAGRYRLLPDLRIACSGVPVSASEDEWLALVGSDPRLRLAQSKLWRLFRQAPVLGSLLNPMASFGADLFSAASDQLHDALTASLRANDQTSENTFEGSAVVAQGAWAAAELLGARYTLVVTNVPYLARGKQDARLAEYCEEHHPQSKHDLATVFVERCLGYLQPGGSTALVTPHNWLFLGRYRKLRECLLENHAWNFTARLGSGAFGTITGEVVKAALIAISLARPREDHEFLLLDAAPASGPSEKAVYLRSLDSSAVLQSKQLHNPDARVLFASDGDDLPLLQEYATGYAGVQTGDYSRFGRKFWELQDMSGGWRYQQSTVSAVQEYGGREEILFWEDGRGELYEYVVSRLGERGVGAWLRGREAWDKAGVCVSSMSLKASIYTGELFDTNVGVIVPKNPDHVAAVWTFCSSPEYREAVRQVDSKLNVTNVTLTKVPFDLSAWTERASEKYPMGLTAPASIDATQWVFNGSILRSSAELQVAVARLIGYNWPEQGEDTVSALSDSDGIVCLPAVGGELAAADRLRHVLAAAYGAEWDAVKQAALLAGAGSPDATLESWIRDEFFVQHCAMFHQRPFIWHVWDGRKDGFAALVNYHKLDRHTLQTLAYTYLGDWITRQEADAKTGTAGADLRIAAARALQRKLELILEGEPPYDIFVRWKPIERQPVGWEPDLNDGVRLNIRPFVMADVLRKKPGIKWGKDRGNNPQGASWGEERLNSYEEYFPGKKLTNAMRLAARADAASGAGAGS